MNSGFCRQPTIGCRGGKRREKVRCLKTTCHQNWLQRRLRLGFPEMGGCHMDSLSSAATNRTAQLPVCRQSTRDLWDVSVPSHSHEGSLPPPPKFMKTGRRNRRPELATKGWVCDRMLFLRSPSFIDAEDEHRSAPTSSPALDVNSPTARVSIHLQPAAAAMPAYLFQIETTSAVLGVCPKKML